MGPSIEDFVGVGRSPSTHCITKWKADKFSSVSCRILLSCMFQLMACPMNRNLPTAPLNHCGLSGISSDEHWFIHLIA
jgi:hypothetical protein